MARLCEGGGEAAATPGRIPGAGNACYHQRRAQVGIAYIKFVKQYKGPVAYVSLDKYLSDPNHLALGAKTARPNAGRLYIEYAVSADGQRAIAQDGEFVLFPGVYPQIKGAEKVTPNMVTVVKPTVEVARKLRSE